MYITILFQHISNHSLSFCRIFTFLIKTNHNHNHFYLNTQYFFLIYTNQYAYIYGMFQLKNRIVLILLQIIKYVNQYLKDVFSMIISEAIKLRINELLKQNNLSAYKLSYNSGISASILSDCLRGKVKEPTISSIIHICEGLEIQLKDFFDSPLFLDVEAYERTEKNKNSICCLHSSFSVSNKKELSIFCKLFQKLCISIYIYIVKCRLNLI